MKKYILALALAVIPYLFGARGKEFINLIDYEHMKDPIPDGFPCPANKPIDLLCRKIRSYQKCSQKDIQEYIQNGGDINAIYENAWNNYTLLQWACHIKLVHNSPQDTIELFIKAGANVNKKNIHGDTALHFACGNGNLLDVEILLNHKADINAQNKQGNTPLHCIALKATKHGTMGRRKNLMQMAKRLLIHGADPFLENHKGKSAATLPNEYGISLLFSGIEYLKKRKKIQERFAAFKESALSGKLIWRLADKENATPPVLPPEIIETIFEHSHYPWTIQEQDAAEAAENLLDAYSEFMQGLEKQTNITQQIESLTCKNTF